MLARLFIEFCQARWLAGSGFGGGRARREGGGVVWLVLRYLFDLLKNAGVQILIHISVFQRILRRFLRAGHRGIEVL